MSPNQNSNGQVVAAPVKKNNYVGEQSDRRDAIIHIQLQQDLDDTIEESMNVGHLGDHEVIDIEHHSELRKNRGMPEPAAPSQTQHNSRLTDGNDDSTNPEQAYSSRVTTHGGQKNVKKAAKMIQPTQKASKFIKFPRR